jgi:hypothetical protein
VRRLLGLAVVEQGRQSARYRAQTTTTAAQLTRAHSLREDSSWSGADASVVFSVMEDASPAKPCAGEQAGAEAPTASYAVRIGADHWDDHDPGSLYCDDDEHASDDEAGTVNLEELDDRSTNSDA